MTTYFSQLRSESSESSSTAASAHLHTVFRFAPLVAPVKYTVLPLSSSAHLKPLARDTREWVRGGGVWRWLWSDRGGVGVGVGVDCWMMDFERVECGRVEC